MAQARRKRERGDGQWLVISRRLLSRRGRGTVAQQGEPEWMLQKRLQAWDTYEKTPAPLGRRGDLGTLRTFSNFQFQQLTPYVAVEDSGSLPAAIQVVAARSPRKSTLRPDRPAQRLAHQDRMSEEFKSQGVILTILIPPCANILKWSVNTS